MKAKIRDAVLKKKEGTVVENLMTFCVGLIMIAAFLIVVLGGFKMVNDRWEMRQDCRAAMLLMETEGYLKEADQDSLVAELTALGLNDVDLHPGTGGADYTTDRRVHYGDPIYLHVTGTYSKKTLNWTATNPTTGESDETFEFRLQSTAKQ